MAKGAHAALLIKGPLKAARRAMAREGLSSRSCRRIENSPSSDVQCYVPCASGTTAKIDGWFAARSRTKAGRGHPPGTLLYHGTCKTGR